MTVQTNARLSDTDTLNTPALIARGFREVGEELQENGKLTHPAAIALFNAGVAALDALRDSRVAAESPHEAMELMHVSSFNITAATAIIEAALTKFQN